MSLQSCHSEMSLINENRLLRGPITRSSIDRHEDSHLRPHSAPVVRQRLIEVVHKPPLPPTDHTIWFNPTESEREIEHRFDTWVYWAVSRRRPGILLERAAAKAFYEDFFATKNYRFEASQRALQLIVWHGNAPILIDLLSDGKRLSDVVLANLKLWIRPGSHTALDVRIVLESFMQQSDLRI